MYSWTPANSGTYFLVSERVDLMASWSCLLCCSVLNLICTYTSLSPLKLHLYVFCTDLSVPREINTCHPFLAINGGLRTSVRHIVLKCFSLYILFHFILIHLLWTECFSVVTDLWWIVFWLCLSVAYPGILFRGVQQIQFTPYVLYIITGRQRPNPPPVRHWCLPSFVKKNLYSRISFSCVLLFNV
jgi:hypothetical protein